MGLLLKGHLNDTAFIILKNASGDTILLKPGEIDQHYENDWYNDSLKLEYLPVEGHLLQLEKIGEGANFCSLELKYHCKILV